jgi:hypothetical protein
MNAKLEQLMTKKKALDAEIARISQQENSRKRKDDLKRKIIAGAIFLKIMESDDHVKNVLLQNINLLPDRDKKLFLIP